MRLIVDEKNGYVSLIFAPSHQAEAKRVLEFAIRLYRREGCDVSELVATQQILESTVLKIQ